MGDTTMYPPPPPPDPTPGIVAMAAASVDKTAMQVGGMVMQTQMQVNMMNLASMRMQIEQQDRLDAKLEIAAMNYEVKMRELHLGHQERMTELANTHVERMADQGHLEGFDVANYKYPYQTGAQNAQANA